MALQIRRGTDAERTAGGGVVFANGELVYVTDTDKLYIGDGATPGGMPLAGSAIATLGEYVTADTINSTLDLQQNLDLNGNNIVGTGNINIAGTITATGNINLGDDASADTVNLAAQITSSLTPNADSTYNIGTPTARWNNGYFTGLVVDGQVDAVAVNANVVANDSSVMVNVSNNIFTGAFAGNVTGNVLGDLTGDSAGTHTGAVVGNTTGYHTGDVTGSVFGDDSTLIVDAINKTLTGNLTGNVTGNVTGDVTGNLKGSISSDPVIETLQGPADAVINAFDITATGTIAGNLTGNVTGDVTGDAAGNHTGTFAGVITATGTFDGDVTGSVFGDDSTLIVDAINKTLTGNLTGNVTGDTAGVHTGNIFTNLIDSADSSAIVITPSLQTLSDLQVDQDLIVGRGGFGVFGPSGTDVKIVPGTGTGFGKVFTDTLEVRTIEIQDGDGGIISIIGEVDLSKTLTTNDGHLGFGDNNLLAYNGVSASLRVAEFTGDLDQAGDFENAANFNNYLTVSSTVADFGTAVQFASMTTTVRDALTAAAGMVVFNTTDTKLQVYTGSAWADLH